MMFARFFMPYQPNGQKLPLTPWLWAYWPVMNVARDGQQSGKESIALLNDVPWRASSRLTFGIFATSLSAWSSVITTRMFGRPSLPTPTGRACAAAGSASTATTVARTTALPLMGRNVQSVSHGVNFRYDRRCDGPRNRPPDTSREPRAHRA